MHTLVWYTQSLVPAMMVHAAFDFIAIILIANETVRSRKGGAKWRLWRGPNAESKICRREQIRSTSNGHDSLKRKNAIGNSDSAERVLRSACFSLASRHALSEKPHYAVECHDSRCPQVFKSAGSLRTKTKRRSCEASPLLLQKTLVMPKLKVPCSLRQGYFCIRTLTPFLFDKTISGLPSRFMS